MRTEMDKRSGSAGEAELVAQPGAQRLDALIMVRVHADLDRARELARVVIGERAFLGRDREGGDRVLEHSAVGFRVANARAVEEMLEMVANAEGFAFSFDSGRTVREDRRRQAGVRDLV